MSRPGFFRARALTPWQEYEASANLVLFEDPVVCIYDLSKFGDDEVMRTHPMIIIGSILQETPFFVPPAEFLRELRARRGISRSEQPVAEIEMDVEVRHAWRVGFSRAILPR